MIGALDLFNITDVFFEKKYKQGGNIELLAPNGKPSKLTSEQYKLVRTPEFKAWFGDWENDPANASKVLDDNGEPLVCYRGNLISQEELGYTFEVGKNFLKKENANKFGFFFTNKIDIAKKYMLIDFFDEIKGGSITSVFLSSNNVLDLRDFGIKIGQQNFVSGLIEKGVKFDGFEYLQNHIINYFENNEYKGWGANVFDYFDVFPDLRKLFIANRYDGVIFQENSRSSFFWYDVYVAFNPNQIKLADGTNTTFDGNNPDIRFDGGGKVLDQYTKQSINKAYVSIRINKEIKRKNQFGFDYVIDYFDTKPFDELSSGILNGVRGVSTSSYNISEWLVHRDCLVVMPFEKFVKHNQVEQVLYFDADYLTKNGLEPFFRLYDRKQKDDSAYYSILQNLFPKISNEFRIEASSETNGGLLNYISEIFNPYNSSKFLSYVAVQPRIQSPEMFAEIVCEYINSGQSKIDYPYYIEYKNVQPEDIVSVLTKGIISSAKIYRDESEWLIKNQQLNIPEGSQLFFVISSYENMKDEYNKIIDAYGLRDKYKVYFISYKDLDRFQQMRWKRKDENFKKEINELRGSVEKKISNALVDIESEIVNEFERNVLHEIENTSYYNPEYFKDFDGNKLGNKYIKTPEVKNLYDNVLFKLSQTIESAIPKVVKDKNKYHLGQVYYEMARYFEELLNQSNNKQFEFFDEYGNKFYQDEFVRIMKYAFNDINFTKYEDSIKSRVGGDLYRAFSKDEFVFAKGGSTLLAPNGKPSNLTPEQYKLVRTPEFKAWFGDWENNPKNASKVVDSNGEPKVMWHGSNAMSEINIFKSNKGHDYSFFSEDKNESSRYVIDFDQTEVAKKIDKRNYTEWTIKRDLYYKSKIKQFFIKSIKPFDYNNLSETDKKYTHEFLNKNKDELYAVIKEFASNTGMSFDVYLKENDKDINITESELLKYFLSSSSDDWWILETKVFQEYIKYNNFDSFVTKESGAWNIAVYNPNQIKLADGTNTTFDGSNPDIRFADGGRVEDLISNGIVELKMFNTTPEHAKQYGLDSVNPLYVQTICVSESKRLQGIGKKVLAYIEKYATENGHDVIFGHITQKAKFTKDQRETFFCDIDMIKNWLQSNGYAINDNNNDFHKVIAKYLVILKKNKNKV